ncbi:DMT family transporter [Chelativorans sp. AA-79]|uniref:DMT family transporter n=1 Tax=Chelativorans sp. AA-79 TaxID=3028735 RepID=UPI0023F9876C|nr:DMT family transporter [Chelativorans sp. AA-79]WEX11186.1 DMT family transporter [Chelativorans sp. AA-79]
MTRLQANILLLLAGAIWGMGFVAQSTAMQAIGPFLFIGLRFAIACIFMLPFALREGKRAQNALSAADWRGFAWIGVILFLGMAAQQVGLLTTTVTNSGFLTGLYVVMVPFLGVLVFRQRPHVIVWPAALTALAGIWLLSGGGAVALKPGDWLTILCALCWAFQVFFIARAASGTGRPVTLAVMQFAVTGAIGLAVALAVEPMEVPAITMALPEILYAGIFSGGIAFTLQVIGQRYTTAPQAAIFLSTEAVFAALFGAVFLGERLPSAGLAGCALILSAILMVELVPALRARRAAS